MNYKETRPWGQFENLLDSDYCKVKEITIKPGQAPSYQYHYKRSEVYVIVKGKALICLDDIEKEFLDALIEHQLPELDIVEFLKYYHEDGLKHLIKNIDYWIQNTFKDLISYSK